MTESLTDIRFGARRIPPGGISGGNRKERMMIDGVSGRDGLTQATTANTGASVRRAGAAFRVENGAGAGVGGAGAAAGAAVPVLQGMLVLQETVEESVPDRLARRRGRDLLSALAGLQRDLLLGAVGSDSLRQLADLLRNLPTADDPDLGESVAAVALRARLELWRHGGVMSRNDSQP